MADPYPVEKVSKMDAGYRLATDSKTCCNCKYMHSDGTCTMVVGVVLPDHTSHFWHPEGA